MNTATVCDACSRIHWNLFFPNNFMARWGKSFILYEGAEGLQNLKRSSESGCALCKLLLHALNASEPGCKRPFFGHLAFWYSGVQPGVKLLVDDEHRMYVWDGQRFNWVYWQNKTMNKGFQLVQSVNARADCAENYALCQAWLRCCDETHDHCRGQAVSGFLPTRLVEVWRDSDDSISARLVETKKEAVESDRRYLALSHCWGTNRGTSPPKTLTSNIGKHVERLDVDSLSQTFMDALQVVINLSMQYIWIDSLCIVQDDPKDFEVECGMMHLIYSQAYCAIVASDSADGAGGCFLPRDWDRVKPCTFHALYKPYENMERPYCYPERAEICIFPKFDSWLSAINGPVSKRGWCFQERELCPRIIYFTRHRILWECRVATASEDVPHMEPKESERPDAEFMMKPVWRILDVEYKYKSASGSEFASIIRWCALVQAYSQRLLSVQTDKLPAISGVAALVAQKGRGDVYLAGIWKNSLLKGLGWFPKRTATARPLEADLWPPPSADLGIPSWSWTAHDGPITFHGSVWTNNAWTRTTDENGEQVWKKEASTTTGAAHVVNAGLDPFGQVSYGEVVLTGWTMEIEVSERDCVPPQHIMSNMASAFFSKCYEPQVRPRQGDHVPAKQYPAKETVAAQSNSKLPRLLVYFDWDVDLLFPTRFLCLKLGSGANARGTTQHADNGIVLMKYEPKEAQESCRLPENPVSVETYRRVGMFDVHKDWSSWLSMREMRTVRII